MKITLAAPRMKFFLYYQTDIPDALAIQLTNSYCERIQNIAKEFYESDGSDDFQQKCKEYQTIWRGYNNAKILFICQINISF